MIPDVSLTTVRALVLLALLAAASFGQSGMLTTTGSGADVTVPDSPALVPANGYTIEAWFYFNPAAPGGPNPPTIMRKVSATPTAYILRVTSASGGNLQFYASTGPIVYCIATSTVATPINSWHHLAGTHDGQFARLYLDGVQVASLACQGAPYFVPGPLEIAKGDPGAESWHGSIDEVRIWSVARTAAEIQSTMMFERDNVPNLVAAWHFNGNYLDTTGGHHGVPNGQVTIQPSTSPVLADQLLAPVTSPIGGPLILTVKSSFPSSPYIADVSLNGNSPGILLPPPVSHVVPLNEPFLNMTYGSIYPSLFVNFLGFTDATSTGTITLNVPNLPWLIGAPIWAAFIALDGSYPLGVRVVGNGTMTILTGPTPTVTSVTPGTSPVAGGAVVTVHGSNFLSGATVKFGTASATNVNVVDGATITCTTPPNPLGPCTVKVTNPDTTVGTLANGFNYVATLTLTGHNFPVATAGTSVTTTGTGLVSGLTMTVGGIAVTPTGVTPSSVTWTVPAGVACNASVILTNPDAQVASIAWNPSPVLTGTIGASGSVSGGSTFFLLGSSFYGGTTVTVGGTPATIVSSNQTSLLVQAPPGSLGPASIVVSSVTGCTASSTYIYQ